MNERAAAFLLNEPVCSLKLISSKRCNLGLPLKRLPGGVFGIKPRARGPLWSLWWDGLNRNQLNIAAVRLTRDRKRERAVEDRHKWILRMAEQGLINPVNGF